MSIHNPNPFIRVKAESNGPLRQRQCAPLSLKRPSFQLYAPPLPDVIRRDRTAMCRWLYACRCWGPRPSFDIVGTER